MNLGLPEVLVILGLALLIFGPKKLPELGRSLGKGIFEFRRATQELQDTFHREITEADRQPSPPAPAEGSAPAEAPKKQPQ